MCIRDRICLQAANGTLSFTVSDDGTGYDARHTPMGSGLRNMADRLAALGGGLEIHSAPGQGTTITGHLLIPATSDGNHLAAVTDSPDAAKPPAVGPREHPPAARRTLIAGHDAADN